MSKKHPHPWDDEDPEFRGLLDHALCIGYRARRDLASVYQEQGRLTEAAAALDRAIRLDPDSAQLHNRLGHALRLNRQVDSAIEAYRSAIRLKPDWADPHNSLGFMLQVKGELSAAVDEYQAAIALDPDHVWAQCNLGYAYQRQGRYAEALRHLERCHELGRGLSKGPELEPFLEQVRAFAERENHLLAILDAREKAEDASELLLAAELAYERGRYGASVRVWRDAFAADPPCADNLKKSYRYCAIYSAALAAAGQGTDAGGLSSALRADLRTQAVEWLEADLEAWRRLVAADEKARPLATDHLRHALVSDADLAVIRDPEWLEKLPGPERKACVALWRAYRRFLEELEGPR